MTALARWLLCPLGLHGRPVVILVVSASGGTGTIHACERCARRMR